MPEYKTYWKEEELPNDGFILARISDDVLDEEDWTTFRLQMWEGVVVKMELINKGVYDPTPYNYKGFTKEHLVLWQYETAPHIHPGFFQELAIEDKGGE